MQIETMNYKELYEDYAFDLIEQDIQPQSFDLWLLEQLESKPLTDIELLTVLRSIIEKIASKDNYSNWQSFCTSKLTDCIQQYLKEEVTL